MKHFLLLSFVLIAAFYSQAQKAPEGLFIASKAPDFKAKDQNGTEIRLKDLLKKGKVVLVFYRGNWCPYCNKELSRLQDSLSFITEKGATLLAITPEQAEGIAKTTEKTKAEYSILHDEGLKIMKAYDVAFELPENTITRYKNAGLDVEKNNGDNGKYLPVPAVFVVDQEQTVRYRFFETDYKKRPSVKEILDNL
ncbi:MAG TPA: peroxiredoxin-like family protein [Chitinophagaceae bacterium]|nr:peroxiredoxin-like family protein [Chitinophagaceae bacterium]